MKRKTLLWLAYMVAVAAGSAPVLVAWELTNRTSQQLSLDVARGLADRMLWRNEQITDQVFAAIRELESTTERPCSDAAIHLMRKGVMRHSRLQAVGYVAEGRLRCSSLGVHEDGGIEMGAPDLVSSNGVEVRIQRRLPFDESSFYRITTSIKSGFTAVVHTDLVFDPIDVQRAGGVGLVATIDFKPITHVGAWHREWAARLGSARDAAFLDQDFVVALRRSERYNYFSYVALPAHQLQDVRREQARVMVPLGLLTGLGTGLLVFMLARQQVGLVADLKTALRRDGQLHLVYQPIIELATGRWAGVEALLRWDPPEGGSISPDVFIPIAERHGLIGQITAKVIELVRRDARTLLRDHPDLFISINAASSDLHGEWLGEQLSGLASDLGVPATAIRIEATERTFIDVGAARAGLARLRDRGHPVAIDDFGTGYSSLSYLATLDVDCLKIDRSFVSTIGTGAVTSEVVPHIIEMAKSLRLRMVAEGVETADQAEYLRLRGVQFAQGWLYSRPLSIDLLEQRLRSQKGRPEEPGAGAMASA